MGWGRVGSGEVGSGRVGSGRVGSGRVGSGRVGSGRVGSGRVGSGRVGLGGVGSDQEVSKSCGSGSVHPDQTRSARRETTHEKPCYNLFNYSALSGPCGKDSPPAGTQSTSTRRVTSYPSELRPLEMSHLGDSGRKVRHSKITAGGIMPMPIITLHFSHTCGTASWTANPVTYPENRRQKMQEHDQKKKVGRVAI